MWANMSQAAENKKEMERLVSRVVENSRQQKRAIGRSTVVPKHTGLADAAFDALQASVVVTDTRGYIVTVNPAFCATTGFSKREVIGQSARSLRCRLHDGAFYREMWQALVAKGSWQGEIWMQRKSGEPFRALLTVGSIKNKRGRPTHFVATCTDLSRNRNSQPYLDNRIQRDELTGLPNRRFLNRQLDEALARAVREGTTGAVIFIDLDHFNLVNDSLGHDAGDELLTMVTQRFEETLHAYDLLARFGGDEFIVILERTGTDGAGTAAAHLMQSLSEPFVLSSGEEICISASLGVSLFPQHSTSPEQLVQYAGAALYHAKEAGRSTHRLYSADLTQRASHRLALDSQMRRALARNEFVLHYQPLVTLDDGRMFGVEALIRWQDPARGMISPGDFLPIAEETGLIVPLGTWGLERACLQMRAWRESGLDLSPIAVNISARQFRHPDFAASVARALKKADLDAHHLELEITEGTLMGHDETTLATLRALKALGVKLAVDDFGTGYSSLAYLKKLPVDKLKIDGSFVTDIGSDPASAAIVTAIIGLGRCLGLEVLAEGIESEQQRATLLASGCSQGQGYLFAAPVRPEEIALAGVRRKGGGRRTARAPVAAECQPAVME